MKRATTPGPWHTGRGSKGKANFGGWQTKVTGTDSVGLVTIAQVFGGNGSNDTAEQCDANARLIAAAPDLLKALARLRQAVEALDDDIGLDQAQAEADAALAKAFGVGQ